MRLSTGCAEQVSRTVMRLSTGCAEQIAAVMRLPTGCAEQVAERSQGCPPSIIKMQVACNTELCPPNCTNLENMYTQCICGIT